MGSKKCSCMTVPIGDDSGVDESELSLQLLFLDGHWSNGRSESMAGAGRKNRKQWSHSWHSHIHTHTHTHNHCHAYYHSSQSISTSTWAYPTATVEYVHMSKLVELLLILYQQFGKTDDTCKTVLRPALMQYLVSMNPETAR